MKPWNREDTQQWIAQLENRIEDIKFYVSRVHEWCEENEVYNEKIIFTCSIMAIVWVCHLRNEPLSKQEIFEILGISNWNEVPDAVLEFNPAYESLELEELLEFVVSSF